MGRWVGVGDAWGSGGEKRVEGGYDRRRVGVYAVGEEGGRVE